MSTTTLPASPLDELARAAVLDVPDGSSWTEVERWLRHAEPPRLGWMATAELASQLGSFGWIRVAGTESFWADDPSRLTRAATSLAAALWQLGQPAALRARGGPAGLGLELGTAPDAVEALGRLVGALLPGTRIADPPVGVIPGADGAAGPTPPTTPTPPHLPSAVLWGPPPTASGEESVLGRLSLLAGSRWTITMLVVPVFASELEGRAEAIALLASGVAAQANHQVALDDLRTATVQDPEAARLLAELAGERERTAALARSGAWAGLTWLEAPTPVDLAAAIGAASATTGRTPSAADPRPGDGRDPDGGWLAVLGPAGPASLLSSREVGEVLRPPAGDRLGLPTRRQVALARHPAPLPHGGPVVDLGTTVDGAAVPVPLGALTSHLLVTGSPGAGKTTAVASLLHTLAALGVAWTVVEPVKREYEGLEVPDLVAWRPGDTDPGPRWILNPLEVSAGTSIQSHSERIGAVFRSSFGLVAPLSHLVSIGLHRVYEAQGWDVAEDRAPADGSLRWPTLSDLIAVCERLPEELGYAPEVRANLRAAIRARLGGLTLGPLGRILDDDRPFPIDDLLDGHVVVNLDAFGDDQVKAFFGGLLVVRMREAFAARSTDQLRHVTVLEEAHRLMGDAAAADAGSVEAGVGAAGHTADELANLLAEIRATGEGLVVVDQSPSRLRPAVLSNTATKVALRADARSDQEVLAAAMGLADAEAHILGGSRRHEALVTWEGMDRPLRVALHHRFVALGDRPPAAPRPAARRVPDPDPVLRAAVRGHVRTEPAEADRPALERRVAAATRTSDPDLIAHATDELIADEVTALGRARRWSPVVVATAVGAATAGRGVPEHPARLLADGRRPLPSCGAACPAGGCLVGEPGREQAEVILAEGSTTLVRLAADPQERHRRLSRRALDAVGADAPERLRRLAEACTTVHVFDQWADPDTVAGLVRGSVPELDDQPAEPTDGR